MNNISERIKLLRKENKLTQKQFADRILVSQSYLSRVENGSEIPNDKLLKLIALEFNVPTSWIEKGEGSPHIDKNTFDYYDRGYEKEFQVGMERDLMELSKLLKKIDDNAISSSMNGIFSEMLNFLEIYSENTDSIRTVVFQQIASGIMECFYQLKEIDKHTSSTEFDSKAWICTFELMRSLNEIKETLFNSDDLKSLYKD